MIQEQPKSILQEANIRNKNSLMVDAMLIEMSKIGALSDRLAKVQIDLSSKATKLKKQKKDNHRLQKNNEELEDRVKSLEEQISSLKSAISEIESQSHKNQEQRFSIFGNTNPGSLTSLQQDRAKLRRQDSKTINTKALIQNYSTRPALKKQPTLLVSPSRELLTRLSNGQIKNIKNPMNLKQVLKSIGVVYQEKIASMNRDLKKGKIQPVNFSDFVYEFYINRFGFEKIAQKNFCFFIISLKYHVHVLRVNIFARMLNLVKGKNYGEDETQKYFHGLHFLLTNKKGFDVKPETNEEGRRSMFPFLRADEYLKENFEDKMNPTEYAEFRQEIEKLKKPDDPMLNGKAGIIDSDELLTRAIEKYQICLNRAKQHVVDAFNSCDLDGDRTCSINEYIMLNRYIENERFDLNKCIEEFFENTDLEEDDEKKMSFDRFATVSVENDIFTKEKQNQFIEVKDDSEIESKFFATKAAWKIQCETLSIQLKQFSSLTEDERESWEHVIEVLDERMAKDDEEGQPESKKDHKAMLIAIKMTKLEFQRIYEEDEGETGEAGEQNLFLRQTNEALVTLESLEKQEIQQNDQLDLLANPKSITMD